jgi:hypothetical protein
VAATRTEQPENSAIWIDLAEAGRHGGLHVDYRRAA